MKRLADLHSPFPYILITLPIVLWGVTMIYPSYDDWMTLSYPNFDRDWVKYFLVYGSVWRPFDAFMGYVSGIDVRLFPLLNHLLVVFGHLGNALIVCKICSRIGFGQTANYAATVFFYLSPCVLGTVLSCDSINQTYSQLWGLLSLWCFLSMRGRARYAVWAVCVFVAALAKENGLAWAMVPPVMAWTFSRADRRTFWQLVAVGMAVSLAYAAIRLSLPSYGLPGKEYSTFVPAKKLRDIAILIAYTWVPADYICLVHTPSRNLWLFALSVVPAIPFILMMTIGLGREWTRRKMLGLTACFVIVMSPNLLINLSVMNAYAGLGIAALMVAYAAQRTPRRYIVPVFALYLVSAVPVDLHHWYMSWKTSVVGRDMARYVIKKTPLPVRSVCSITVKSDEKKFSSFCVLPEDAFDGGQAVIHETGCSWPENIKNIQLGKSEKKNIPAMAKKALDSGLYDCVWVTEDTDVKIFYPEKRKRI